MSTTDERAHPDAPPLPEPPDQAAAVPVLTLPGEVLDALADLAAAGDPALATILEYLCQSHTDQAAAIGQFTADAGAALERFTGSKMLSGLAGMLGGNQ